MRGQSIFKRWKYRRNGGNPMSIYLKTVSANTAGQVPDASLRWDLAWMLFLPDYAGDIPEGYPEPLLARLTAWAWERFGDLSGRLRTNKADPIWCLVPPLTPAAEEYVVRISSFWDDEIYRVSDDGQPISDNLWIAPLVNVHSKSNLHALDEALGQLENSPQRNRVFFPHLGMGRLHVMVVTVDPGQASARLHAHSAVDEYYLILKGRGTLRMGTHTVSVNEGTLIGKPSGPDLTSQVLADLGETVTILDIEAWSDARQDAKDVMYYADFGELQMHNIGWDALIPDEALYSSRDKKGHYSAGYHRNLDGSWTPREIPAAPPRKDE